MATFSLQSELKMDHILLMIVYWSFSAGQAESTVCPAGFILLNTCCYYFSESSTTRVGAQDTCSSVGATLASLSTAEEDATVAAYLNTLGGGLDYWIGITQHNALEFEWADGSPLEFTNWGDKFDPHDERTNCIRMESRLDWQWYDKSCGGSYFNYMCEGPRGEEACSSVFNFDSVEYGTSCYTIANDADKPVNHPMAKLTCEAEGGYLVTLNTQDERSFVEEQAVALNYSGVWLGLTQSDYGNYKWMNEEQFNYTNYVSSPFYYGSDCFRMLATDGYKWADDLCTRTYHFICEKEALSKEVVKIRKFRVGRKNSIPIAQNTLSNESSPNLSRCGSSCISQANCSSFAYNEKTRRCLLSGPLNQVDVSTDSDVYYLQENTPEDTDKRIFISEGQKLWMADILKMEFREIPTAVTSPLKATYDRVKGYAYVAQSSYLLSRVKLDASDQQWIDLTSGVGNSISDLSLDVRFRRLYVVLSPPDVIVAYNIDSSDPTPTDFVNTALGTPRAVHAVSSKGHVYFSHDGTIERIDCDGSNRMAIYSGSPMTDVLILTVDLDTGKIFAVDANVQDIIYMNLDGTNVAYYLQEAVTVRGLGYHAGLLYWTDSDSMLRVSSASPGSTITTEGGSIFADARRISIN